MYTWPMLISIFSSVSIWATKPPLTLQNPQLLLLTVSPADKETSWALSSGSTIQMFSVVPCCMEPGPSYILMGRELMLLSEHFVVKKKILECWNLPECITFIKKNTPNSLLMLESEWCHKVIIKITWFHHSHKFLWNERDLGFLLSPAVICVGLRSWGVLTSFYFSLDSTWPSY